MGKLTLSRLRAAEKVIQRTYFMAGRSAIGLNAGVGVETGLVNQVSGLTLLVLEQRRLRYNQPVVEAVDSLMKEKLGWW